MLSPQQYAKPLTSSPQVWNSPAVRPWSTNTPLTSAGVEWLSVVPSPNWPKLLRPQQYTAPPDVAPHACWSPTASEVKAGPDTAVGIEALVVVPLPSWP